MGGKFYRSGRNEKETGAVTPVQIVITRTSRGAYRVLLMSETKTFESEEFDFIEDAMSFVSESMRMM